MTDKSCVHCGRPVKETWSDDACTGCFRPVGACTCRINIRGRPTYMHAARTPTARSCIRYPKNRTPTREGTSNTR